jgi:hypothetical protein
VRRRRSEPRRTSEPPPPGLGEQRLAQQRKPADGRDADVVEAEVVEQAVERAPRVEAQVLSQRGEVGLEASQRDHGSPQAPVRRGGDEEPARRPQHTPDLRQPAGRVGDVLDDLGRPHHVEARVLQRPRPVRLDQQEAQAGVALPRALDRPLRHLDPDRLGAGAGQLRAERPLAAADVEHPLPRPHPGQQEVASASVLERRQVGWHPGPDVLVELPHRASVRCRSQA